ncbi:MAG: S8 family serine peptidase [Planctomycetota bacterium]|nr:S8 family serine peptidase [Planctomycetota bacterium]
MSRAYWQRFRLTKVIMKATFVLWALGNTLLGHAIWAQENRQDQAGLLSVEKLPGKGVWVSPNAKPIAKLGRRVIAKVWFEDQFLGDGGSYRQRAEEFDGLGRQKLREQVMLTLREQSRQSFAKARRSIEILEKEGVLSGFKRHWIVNGFTCTTTIENLDELKKIPGVRKIFLSARVPRSVRSQSQRLEPSKFSVRNAGQFKPGQYQHPWYVYSLLADRVWKNFGVTGKGTLNVIHDFNFVFTGNLAQNVYRNPNEVPANGKDDDGNGLVDDVHGFNFRNHSGQLMVSSGETSQSLHGMTCALIVCGTGTTKTQFEFGIAPEAKWAGVIAGADLESAVEWAILQGADTYSMSFSIPNLGELRSHWRKVMEHGAFCGVYFVSGAGNFSQTAEIPVQMRTPEDIPDVVFAAAGVQRDLTRTRFSSSGPVEWNTEHYQDGKVQKPEVCAFNQGLPLLMPNGSIRIDAANGNSFAGPMFCGAIALMLSADPDLPPWELKEIITQSALDVGPPGIDSQTGHGLINCYRAVKEVLRRKAIRQKRDATKFTGREKGDELDVKKLKADLADRSVIVASLKKGGDAAKAGFRPGDILTKVSGVAVQSATQFQELLKKNPSAEIVVQVTRNGEKRILTLTRSSLSFGRLREIYKAPIFK